MPSLAELKSSLAKAKEYHSDTTRIVWRGQTIPLPHKASINVLADNILTSMSDSQYENLVVCGKSGSGKTTFVTNLLHNMVCKRIEKGGRHFTIQWYRQGDIGKLDDTIKEITPGTPTILVLDDVSYELSKVSAGRKKDIFSAMTTIRHQVKSEILVVFITHYSRSLEKYLRSDAGYTVLLSLSNQELGNWIDIFGDWAKWKLTVFQNQFARSKQKGTFGIKTSDGGYYNYTVKEPFKIALVNELGTDLHPVLFQNEYCANCSNGKSPPKIIDPDVMIAELNYSYGKYGIFVLREYLAEKLGRKDILPAMLMQARAFVVKMFNEYSVNDFDALADKIASKTRNKHKTKKQQKALEMMALRTLEPEVSS